MGKRGEDQVGFGEWCVIGCDERDLSIADSRALAALSVCSRKAKLQAGVTLYELTELPPGVSAGAKYSNRNFMHC
jgi:hypothetical protein